MNVTSPRLNTTTVQGNAHLPQSRTQEPAESDYSFGPCIDGPLDGLSSGTHVAATVGAAYGGRTFGGDVRIVEAVPMKPVDPEALKTVLREDAASGKSPLGNSWGSSNFHLMKTYSKTAESLGQQVDGSGFILAK